ncbi:MAG TPA: ferrochelatase [Micropepsaceae bacterium]|nr:ferrochelatase [Micropepsaceae bacterium]
MKLGIVLFNLGGPDRADAVRPFLRNLFSDRAIIDLPGIVRYPLARFIADRRALESRQIFAQIGGRSPILAETEAQARALEAELARAGHEAKAFVAMRYWHPFTQEAAAHMKMWNPDYVVLLPLYPQYSTTTSRSSLAEWHREAARQHLKIPTHEVCCFPVDEGFVSATAALLREALQGAKPDIAYRLLFSAHGLPKRVIDRGDPYQWQVEQTVAAVVERLGRPDLAHQISYQSRVGRLEWIGPATDAEIRRAGQEGKGIIVVPIAFVCEHSETLFELDIKCADIARESGVPDYIRVPTVRAHAAFIGGLANLVLASLKSRTPVSCVPGRMCPSGATCGQNVRHLHG